MRYDYTQEGNRYDGKRVLLTTLYPDIPLSATDVYITSNQSERLDHLSLKYYKDANYWWIIALANNLGQGSLSIPPGSQIRIPLNIANIISSFKTLNAS